MVRPEFFAEFEGLAGAAMPIGGPSAYCLDGQDSRAVRMMNLLAEHFSSTDCTAALMIKHHWQMVQASSSDDIRLYECLHLCAVLEGVVRDILSCRFGWSKPRLKKASARQRFEAVCKALGLRWEGQFEIVVNTWIQLRNSLAHGDFFGPGGAQDQDVFKLHTFVSGGILAMILANAGWSDAIDFTILNQTSHLYY